MFMQHLTTYLLLIHEEIIVLHVLNFRTGLQSDKAATCVIWLDKWMAENADKLPHRFLSEEEAKDVIQWPACFDIRSIYTIYAADMAQQHTAAYSYDGFCKILRSDRFKHCKRATRNSEFKCKTCLGLRKELEKLRRNNVGKINNKKIKAKEQEIKDHKERFFNQRLKYKKHQIKARNNPNKYLCCIIDGMDQSKLNLPNLKDRADLWQTYGRLAAQVIHCIQVIRVFLICKVMFLVYYLSMS